MDPGRKARSRRKHFHLHKKTVNEKPGTGCYGVLSRDTNRALLADVSMRKRQQVLSLSILLEQTKP